jgi:peptidoglycan/xylan/chitin deacetylase (PgdA/CDA1 family)
VVSVLPTTAKLVALTFDGGASDSGVPSILGTLADEEVPATFFVTGDFARRYPNRVRAMAAAGHRVANHSDTHPDFTTLTASQQVAQLDRAEAVIRGLTGATTHPWFRFPFGASNPAAIDTVNDQGYGCIGWTVDTLGWKGTSGGQSVDSVVDRVLDTARAGQIVLMHVGANPDDGTTLDADALPRIIDGLRAAGYRFVTLDAALG